MAFRYKLLWLQSVKNLNKTDVIAMQGLQQMFMVAQMSKDKSIIFKNLKKMCKALSFTPNDTISFEMILVTRIRK